MYIEIKSESEMKAFGAKLASHLAGGEFIELVGDIGAGKTTLVKGLAVGLGIDEDVQSPTFTISRVYEAPGNRTLAHYDFYRLEEAGVLGYELSDLQNDPLTITVIEWAGIVSSELPEDYLKISIIPSSEDTRRLELAASGPMSRAVLEKF